MFLFFALLWASQAGAQKEKEKKEGGGDLRSAVQNPVSSLISLSFKFTFDFRAPNGEATFLNIQPVYPVTVGDWNLGDINYSMFFSPVKYDKIIWGVGPSISFPSAPTFS